MLSIYALDPRFQSLLRLRVGRLARVGVRASAVTVLAACLSVAVGAVLLANPAPSPLWLIFPAAMLLRMALNAADGMLAREFGQQSKLGCYLNEIGDVISDAAMLVPFMFLPAFDARWIGAAMVLAAISEMAKRKDGPMGKSDRAVVFGGLALWIGLGGSIAPWVAVWFPRVVVALLAITIVN